MKLNTVKTASGLQSVQGVVDDDEISLLRVLPVCRPFAVQRSGASRVDGLLDEAGTERILIAVNQLDQGGADNSVTFQADHAVERIARSDAAVDRYIHEW